MSKYLACLFFFLLLSGRSNTQNVSSQAVDLLQKAPKSPNVASLSKYLEFPVNMATGVPNISIPLYEIKQGNITVPIVLRYNASGVKVNDYASWVGMGWTLEVGGVITRRVNGLDDFFIGSNSRGLGQTTFVNPDNPTYYGLEINNISDFVDSSLSYNYFHSIPHSPNIGGHKMFNFYGKVADGLVDGEADDFFYSAPGISGNFNYDQKLQRFESGKIDGTFIGYNYNGVGQNAFLINHNGNLYKFESVELARNRLWEKSMGIGGCCMIPYPADQKYNQSAWHLTEIIDGLSNQSITFSYADDWATTYHGFSQSKNYQFMGSGFFQYAGENNDEIIRYGMNKVINRINFNNGYIVFIKDTNSRLDGGPNNSLAKIKVYNKDNELIKEIQFDYFYSSSSNNNTCIYQSPFTYGQSYCSLLTKRLFLNKVTEVSQSLNQNGNGPSYEFIYEDPNSLPFRLSFAQDYWGFYNGKINNITSLPSIPELQSLGLPEMANRKVDSNYTRKGILNKIKYPTGGASIFHYENNYVNNTIWNNFLGGMRIKQIEYYDNVSDKSMITGYEYVDDNNISSGQILSAPKFHYEYAEIGQLTPIITTIKSDPINTLFPSSGSAVIYTQVNKIEKSALQENLSKYFFTGYSGNNSIQDGLGVPFPKYNAQEDNVGNEYKQEFYKKTNGQFVKVSSLLNTLVPINNYERYRWNMQAAWTAGYSSNWFSFKEYDPYIYANEPPSRNCYKIFKESIKNTETISELYDANSSITNKKFRSYSRINGNILTEKTIKSNSDIVLTTYKYPSDFAGIPIYDQMVAKNMISYPIETKTVNQTTGAILDWKYQNYRDVGNGIIALKWLDVYDRQKNIFTTEVTYDKYDLKANIEQLTTRQGIPQSYLYAYNKNYPIAQAVNAKSNELFHENFEETSVGWSNNTPVIDYSFSRTGKGSGRIDNPTSGEYVSHAPSWLDVTITTPTKYKYSGWVYSNGPSAELFFFMKYNKNNTSLYFDFVTAVGTFVTNKWTYIEGEYTVPAGITALQMRLDNNGGGTVWFDDLRICPSTAQMTTYTYTPLIGITSQTDVNNRSTYYEYDGFNRLMLVRDNDKNVLKKYCYNYAGQTESCQLFGNQDQSGIFYSQNCQSGQTAEGVYVSIPANQYYSTVSQADANAQAIQYGQSYANQNGTCTSSDFDLKYTNYTNAFGSVVELYNTSTGQYYYFQMSFGGGILGSISAGNYDVTVYPSYYDYYSCDIGCGYYAGGWGSVSFFGIPLNPSCNSLNLY